MLGPLECLSLIHRRCPTLPQSPADLLLTFPHSSKALQELNGSRSDFPGHFALGGLVRSTTIGQPETVPPAILWETSPLTGSAVLALLVMLQSSPSGQPAIPPEAAASFDPMASEAMRSDAGWPTSASSIASAAGPWATAAPSGTPRTAAAPGSSQASRASPAAWSRSGSSTARRGWAAGGCSHPYTHASSGVVLRTRDGGRTWTHDPRLLLPAMRRVRFVDDRHGWAAGRRVGHVSLGRVRHRRRRPELAAAAPATRPAAWHGGRLLDPHHGRAGRPPGHGGRPSAAAGSSRPGSPRPGAAASHDSSWSRPLHGWLVGDGGLLMRTDDLGATWQTPPGPLPDGIGHRVRLRRRWPCAGRRSGSPARPAPDRATRPTPAGPGPPLPRASSLRSTGLSFVDDEHGWAVGALGTILATDDGGRTWRRQRTGGTRAALLAVFSQPDDVPLELLAQLSGNEGYLGVVEVLGRRDVETPPRRRCPPGRPAARGRRGRGGLRRRRPPGVSPCARPAWALRPSRSSRRGIEANDGRGLDSFEARLVRQIRLWRPEIIVTHDASPRATRPLGHLVDQAVLAGGGAGGRRDLLRGPAHRAPGWARGRSRRSMPRLGPQPGGDVELTTAQLAPGWAARWPTRPPSRGGCWPEQFDRQPEMLGFRLLRATGCRRTRGGRTSSPASCSAARRRGPAPAGRAAARRPRRAPPHGPASAATWRPSWSAVDRDPHGGAALVGQSANSPAGSTRPAPATPLPPGAAILSQRAVGRWPPRPSRCWPSAIPTMPLAGPALLWLVQYYASGEAAWRVQGASGCTTVQASAPADRPGPSWRTASGAGGGRGQGSSSRPTRACSASRPCGFPLCVADRVRGFRATPTATSWPSGAAPRTTPGGPVPRPSSGWPSRRGSRRSRWPSASGPSVKPHLDGKLDDPLWQAGQAGPAAQCPAATTPQWPAEVDAGLRHRVSVRGRAAAAGPSGSSTRPRPGPGPATRTSRRRTGSTCCWTSTATTPPTTGFRSTTAAGPARTAGATGRWNPTWFVAAGGDRRDLDRRGRHPAGAAHRPVPGPRDAWAVGIQRTVPGVGFQSWTTPAAAATVVPEGAGYLIFD